MIDWNKDDEGRGSINLLPVSYVMDNWDKYRDRFAWINVTDEEFKSDSKFARKCDVDDVFKLYLGLDTDFEYSFERALSTLRSRKDIEDIWIIELNNEFIGVIYTHQRVREYNKCKLSIGLLKNYRNKGLGSMIVRLVTDRLLSDGYLRVAVEVDKDNEVGLRMFNNRKTGYTYEGTLRNNYGKGVDIMIYSCIDRNDIWLFDDDYTLKIHDWTFNELTERNVNVSK